MARLRCWPSSSAGMETEPRKAGLSLSAEVPYPRKEMTSRPLVKMLLEKIMLMMFGINLWKLDVADDGRRVTQTMRSDWIFRHVERAKSTISWKIHDV